jgi:hypothetical protein
MKLNDWYDIVPAFVGTFGVLSIGRTLGRKGAQRAFDAGRPSGLKPRSRSGALTVRQKLCKFWQLIWLPRQPLGPSWPT